MTVEELLRIPLELVERGVVSLERGVIALEKIASTVVPTERPSARRSSGPRWSSGGAPERVPIEPPEWTVTPGVESERGPYVYVDGPPFLSPDEARGLAAGLLRAADEAEGL